MYTFDEKIWILFKLSKKNENHAKGVRTILNSNFMTSDYLRDVLGKIIGQRLLSRWLFGFRFVVVRLSLSLSGPWLNCDIQNINKRKVKKDFIPKLTNPSSTMCFVPSNFFGINDSPLCNKWFATLGRYNERIASYNKWFVTYNERCVLRLMWNTNLCRKKKRNKEKRKRINVLFVILLC